jgi:hypothetical protein
MGQIGWLEQREVDFIRVQPATLNDCSFIVRLLYEPSLEVLQSRRHGQCGCHPQRALLLAELAQGLKANAGSPGHGQTTDTAQNYPSEQKRLSKTSPAGLMDW